MSLTSASTQLESSIVNIQDEVDARGTSVTQAETIAQQLTLQANQLKRCVEVMHCIWRDVGVQFIAFNNFVICYNVQNIIIIIILTRKEVVRAIGPQFVSTFII